MRIRRKHFQNGIYFIVQESIRAKQDVIIQLKLEEEQKLKS